MFWSTSYDIEDNYSSNGGGAYELILHGTYKQINMEQLIPEGVLIWVYSLITPTSGMLELDCFPIHDCLKFAKIRMSRLHGN